MCWIIECFLERSKLAKSSNSFLLKRAEPLEVLENVEYAKVLENVEALKVQNEGLGEIIDICRAR